MCPDATTYIHTYFIRGYPPAKKLPRFRRCSHLKAHIRLPDEKVPVISFNSRTTTTKNEVAILSSCQRTFPAFCALSLSPNTLLSASLCPTFFPIVFFSFLHSASQRRPPGLASFQDTKTAPRCLSMFRERS